ncbi:uncharacterized protein J4E79_001789 [Alternaria viburni]|uniref:uncharacterized protein n=1 Tax=Alternaria viburni TaxID=566460 RepID=UPI0020C32EFF|nr:uncharacterized protein J4E79_001789 [Alternaria viburni]KAI4667105.1 hypothetical protein J4E79_001789 [Alternaria viburni]
MNVERCIALHNEILRHGWVSSGCSPESLEATCKTWFDTFGDDAEAVRPQLSPDLVRFLQEARLIGYSESVVDLSFFYWLQNLASPNFMFEQAEDWSDDGEDGNLLVLYEMNNFSGHWCGLVYDQEANLCILSPSIHDADEVFEQKVWYPLETALEFWLGQIRKGKIVAAPKAIHEKSGNERYDPWEFIPYSKSMLEENVEAFNRLVETIETRMPSTAEHAEAEQVVHGLVEESILQSMSLPHNFTYDFLRQARRPRFRNIAPGLEVTTSIFSDQPFGSYLSSTSDRPPILLFRFNPNTVTGEEIDNPFPGFDRIKTHTAGLYLLPHWETTAEDECRLILPFGIGANGYARRTDGSKFGGKEDGEDSHVDMYRPGYQPLEEPHDHSLVDVLKSWTGMVERGDWQIDENGVAGGMDVWREADSKEKWAGG